MVDERAIAGVAKRGEAHEAGVEPEAAHERGLGDRCRVGPQIPPMRTTGSVRAAAARAISSAASSSTGGAAHARVVDLELRRVHPDGETPRARGGGSSG